MSIIGFGAILFALWDVLLFECENDQAIDVGRDGGSRAHDGCGDGV